MLPKKEDIEKLMDGKKADMVFTDPPYDLDLNILKQCFENVKEITELQFWMLSDKQAVGLCPVYDNFNVFFIHDYVVPTLLNNNMRTQRHNLIAQFGKRKSRNLFDGFSSIISVPTLRITKEHKIFRWGKRIELPKIFIQHFCNESVLDIFGGAGSTLLASEIYGFKSYIMEIEPLYIDLILNRYKNIFKKTIRKIK